MTEFLTYLAATVLGLIVAFMPWFIYAELKQQGKARSEEALKIISLLGRIAGSPQDRNADYATGLQAVIDAKSLHVIPALESGCSLSDQHR